MQTVYTSRYKEGSQFSSSLWTRFVDFGRNALILLMFHPVCAGEQIFPSITSLHSTSDTCEGELKTCGGC